MPNGRSSSFNVTRHDFEQLLNTIPTGTLVGHLLSGSEGDRSSRALDALEARQLFAELPQDRVFVEEQYQKFYILHLGMRRSGGSGEYLSAHQTFEQAVTMHDEHLADLVVTSAH